MDVSVHTEALRAFHCLSCHATKALLLHLAGSKLHGKPDSAFHIPLLVVTQKGEEYPGDERVTCPYCTTGQGY